MFKNGHATRAMQALGLVSALLLTACGGGGGGEDNSWLHFTPGTLTATSYEGESSAVAVGVTVDKVIDEAVSVGIVDQAGVLTTDLTLTQQDSRHFTATFNLSPQLAAGDYSGSLTVRLCRDDPRTCASPYPGSPWTLPYAFKVLPGTHLSPLSALAGAGAWGTFQGNASHTGAVPARVNASLFNRRWAWSGPASAVTVEGGRVFTTSSDGSGHWLLTALSEATGEVLWQADMGPLSRVNPPAVSGGKVYVSSTGHSDTYLWMFDAATGTQLARQPMSSQWEEYLSPTVYGGQVYTESGGYGGLSSFEADGLLPDWWVSLAQYDSWTPAVDASGVYAHTGSLFYALDPADGGVRWSLEDTGFQWAGYSMHAAPVLDGAGHAFLVQYGASGVGRLLSVDLTNRRWGWALDAQVYSNPALADGTLYLINGGQFEARSAATGALLWTWSAPEGFGQASWSQRGRVVVMSNLAFVTSASRTYAVDLTTHQPLWSYPAVGDLAVSANGVLYIARQAGGLVAINLQ